MSLPSVIMFALGFVIVLSLLPTPVACENESSQCPELSVSLLQTHSFVRHSVPNDFFEDDIVVPNAVEHRTNYHAEAQRQSQVEEPVVPLFDVGNHAVPLPHGALPNSGKINAPLALAETMESRQQTSSRGSREDSSEEIVSAISQPQRTLVPQEAAQEAESSSAQVDFAPAQVDDHLELKVLATEPPLPAQLPVADLQLIDEHQDTSEQFVECQADAAGEECMKAKMRSRQSAPSPFLPASQRLPVDEYLIQDKIKTQRKAGDQRFSPGTLDSSPTDTLERQKQNDPDMVNREDQFLFESQTPLQRFESNDRTGHPELLSNSKTELPAEDLERKAEVSEEQQLMQAEHLEEQQQRLLYKERVQKLMQLQQLDQMEQHMEKQRSRANDYSTQGSYMDWLGQASVSEVRDFFDAKAFGRNNTNNTHSIEASLVREFPASRREERIKPQLIPAKDEFPSLNDKLTEMARLLKDDTARTKHIAE